MLIVYYFSLGCLPTLRLLIDLIQLVHTTPLSAVILVCVCRKVGLLVSPRSLTFLFIYLQPPIYGVSLQCFVVATVVSYSVAS